MLHFFGHVVPKCVSQLCFHVISDRLILNDPDMPGEMQNWRENVLRMVEEQQQRLVWVTKPEQTATPKQRKSNLRQQNSTQNKRAQVSFTEDTKRGSVAAYDVEFTRKCIFVEFDPYRVLFSAIVGLL